MGNAPALFDSDSREKVSGAKVFDRADRVLNSNEAALSLPFFQRPDV
jgi:hypothetical protein